MLLEKPNKDNKYLVKHICYKILKLHNLTIVVGSVFPEDKKYYTQVSLDECLYE